MTDFVTLKADVADYLAREDLTAQIPGFIRLCEARLRRAPPDGLRVQQMMRRAAAAGADSVYLSLPSDYLEMRRLRLDNMEIDQVAPEAFRPRQNGGYAKSYTIHREIEFDAPVSSDSSIEMVYYAAFAALSDTDPSNWLSVNAYDAYLYGSLVAAEPYLRNDERIGIWQAGYTNAVNALNETDRRGRVNRGGQRFRMSGATP